LTDNSRYNEFINLKVSGFWNFTNAIFIDDTDPNYNWSKTAADNNWCSGYGNSTHPYVIEDIVMDLNGSGTCITIQNSNAYFLIDNCSISNAQYGINLTKTTHGLINNTTVSNLNAEPGSPGSGGMPGTPGTDGTESIGIIIEKCSNINLTLNKVFNIIGGNGGAGGNGSNGILGNIHGGNGVLKAAMVVMVEMEAMVIF